MINSMRRNALILAGFALASTVLVLTTQWLTKDRIAEQQRNELMTTLNLLIPPQMHSNDLYADCTLVSDPALGLDTPQPVYRSRQQGEPTALAVRTTAPDGYSGNIHLLVAVDLQGQVLGVRTLAHRETPGLGDKIEARRSDWIDSFTGQTVRDADDPRWEVRRDGGMFDAFAGATITPRAVVNAVQRTVLFAQQNQARLFAAETTCRPASVSQRDDDNAGDNAGDTL